MPAKQAKKSSPPVKYLLSGDRKLRKLSLRKLSERTRKAKAPAPRRRANGSAEARASATAQWLHPGAMIIAAIGVVGAVAFIAASGPSDTVEFGSPVEAAASAPEEWRPAAAPQPPPSAKPAVVSRAAAESVPAAATSANAAKGDVEAAARAELAEADMVTEADTGSAVTITGCLERDKGTFWLKNTSGENVPRSRSWRSGFLTRRSANIQLVGGGAQAFSRYVGQRVAATGTVTDRQMRAQSVQRIAASCD